MTGLLAQTNAYIREAERRHREAKAHQQQWKRPIQLIDRLLQDLEELNIRGHKRVPLSYEARLREILDLVASIPALSDRVASLRVKIGIGKLMDGLFAVEEALFAQRYGPSYEPDGGDFGGDLVTAA